MNIDSVGGSFSVGRPVQSLNTPRGNALFTDLVEAVFALEAAILPHRTASRMVAINRRASFLPHKDSGLIYCLNNRIYTIYSYFHPKVLVSVSLRVL